MPFQLDCAVDCVKALRNGTARELGVYSHGRTILPDKGLIEALMSRPCRCKKHRRPALQIAPAYPTSGATDSDWNPIWGNDKPLSMQDAALFVGMPLGTLRQKVYRREIASVMVGRERKIQPSALRSYLDQCKRPAL